MDVARQSAGSNRRNLYVLAGQKRNLAKKSRPPALPIWPHLACVRSAIHEALPPVAGPSRPSPHAQRTCVYVCGEWQGTETRSRRVESSRAAGARTHRNTPLHLHPQAIITCTTIIVPASPTEYARTIHSRTRHAGLSPQQHKRRSVARHRTATQDDHRTGDSPFQCVRVVTRSPTCARQKPRTSYYLPGTT
jgi:hypothetical protein